MIAGLGNRNTDTRGRNEMRTYEQACAEALQFGYDAEAGRALLAEMDAKAAQPRYPVFSETPEIQAQVKAELQALNAEPTIDELAAERDQWYENEQSTKSDIERA